MANVKHSPEKLLTIVELIERGVMVKARHAKAVGVSDATLSSWQYRSNANDPAFVITYLGEEMQFAKAMAIAQRFAYRELRANAEQFAILGRKRRTTFQGQFVPKLDPVAFALSPEDREWLGYHPLAYALDENGAVLWNEEHIDAPIGLLDRFLQTFPDLQTTTNQNLNVKGVLTHGVQILPKADYSKEPPAIPPAPPIPLLEVIAPEEIVVTADDMEDLLGPEPQPDRAPEPGEPEYVQPTAPSRAADDPTDRTIRDMPTAREMPPKQQGILKPPLAHDATPPRAARTPLEQSLFDELEKARQRKMQL
jgi:hypothetical protein